MCLAAALLSAAKFTDMHIRLTRGSQDMRFCTSKKVRSDMNGWVVSDGVDCQA